MMAHQIAVAWTLRVLRPFAYMVCENNCGSIHFYYPSANSILMNSQTSELKKCSRREYSRVSNIRNSPWYTESNVKDNFQSQKVVLMSLKAAGSRSSKSETSTPSQRVFPWMINIHRLLLKSVIFPSEKQDLAQFSKKSPHSFSTSALMSMALDIQRVNMETMKIIVALWRRFDAMTVEEILTTADIFFYRDVSVPWYTSAMITYFDEIELRSFTPLQLTRLVFHISCHGSAPLSILSTIEKRILENLSQFDINLIAIICQLFFTEQTRIKSQVLVDKIATKLLEDLGSLNESNLLMLMKMFRFSHYINISFYQEFGNRLITLKYFNRFHPQSHIMHIAFTYASVRMSHPQLFEAILKYCQVVHSKHRLKDIGKIIWACGTLVTNQESSISYIHNILLQLKTSNIHDKVREYPDNMVELLVGLAYLNIYPHDFLNMVFDPAILKILLGLPPDREKFFQLMFLDHSLSIECPNYSGFRLTQADYDSLARHVSGKCLELDMQFRKSVKPALTALENILGPDYVQCKFVLPHCRTSDIVLAYDMNKKVFVKPVELPLRPSTNVDEHSFSKTTKDLVLLLLSKMQNSYNGQSLGVLYCKMRQLQAVGYHVITIDADETSLYSFLDMKTIQNLLLRHISAALGTDVSKDLQSKHNG